MTRSMSMAASMDPGSATGVAMPGRAVPPEVPSVRGARSASVGIRQLAAACAAAGSLAAAVPDELAAIAVPSPAQPDDASISATILARMVPRAGEPALRANHPLPFMPIASPDCSNRCVVTQFPRCVPSCPVYPVYAAYPACQVGLVPNGPTGERTVVRDRVSHRYRDGARSGDARDGGMQSDSKLALPAGRVSDS